MLDSTHTFENVTSYPYLGRGGSRERVQGCAPPPPQTWNEAFFFIFAFKICLPHQSVTSFLRGAPYPEKNPGSAPTGVFNWVENHVGRYRISGQECWQDYQTNMVEISVDRGRTTDRTQWGLFTRQWSRFSNTDWLSSVDKMFITAKTRAI